jgi:hypothetical protein
MRWWLVFAVAACGDNIGVGETHSGSQLKLAWHQYEGGARQLAGFYDGDRPCDLVEWADGKRRCMTDTFFDQVGLPRVVYADASCTSRLGVTDGVSTVAYEGEIVNDVFRPARVFAVGDFIATPPQQLFERRDGACVMTTIVRSYLVELGLEQSLDHLVAMTRSELPPAGRIGHVVDRGDDGSSIWRGFYDHELATPCTLEDGDAGALRCVPSESHVIEHFADAACSEPAVVVAAGSVPRFASSAPDVITSCTTHYATGAAVTGPVYQRTPGDGCLEVSIGDRVAFRTAAPITSFASVERFVEDGPDRRIQATRLVAGSLVAPATGLFDTKHDELCASRSEFPGETVRCLLPVTFQTFALHADASCETEQAVALVPLTACYPPDRYARIEGRYHAILDPIAVYGDDCRPLAAPEGHEYRALGPAFDVDELAVATLVVDP